MSLLEQTGVPPVPQRMPGTAVLSLWAGACLLIALGLGGHFPLASGNQGAGREPTADTNEHRSYTETIPGSNVHFAMMAIPGGTFRMGSPDSEPGRGPDEGPAHPVRVRPFWMGACEVTWTEYDLFR